jgi:diguanylate cyclase (GGDEF)-like protein/PAS domain S-box-containing protein
VIAGGKGAIASLPRSLRGYQTMFERGVLGLVVVDVPSFRIGIVNRVFASMTGYGEAEIVGINFARIFPSDLNVGDDIAGHLPGGRTDGYTHERLMKRRDGSRVLVLSTVSVLRDKAGDPVQLLAVVEDLTSQRRSEHVARRSEALIDAAISALPVTFSTFDADLRLTFVAGGRDQAGVAPGEYLGKAIKEITHDPAAIRALEVALAGFESTSRTLINGNTYLSLNAPMRDEAGVIVGVVSVNNNITAEVAAEAERRQRDETRLFAGRHDPLTGLLGRPGLIEHLNALALSNRCAGALLLLDLDDFNLINDSFGNTMGDAVLLEVASRISGAFPELVIARYGGDAFAIVAPFVVKRADAVHAALRACATLDADVEIFGQAIRITASLGVALEGAHGSSMLLRNADSALAHAKHAGTGQYRLYDGDMRREVQDRIGIRGGLQSALKDGRLQVAYQPIVNLGDRSTIGAEALLRWTDPKRGPVPPTEFIPIAEDSGLIVPIGTWVMTTACANIESLHVEGMYVAVNVSARQFVGGVSSEWVENILARTGLSPRDLTVEVTETALMDDIDVVRPSFDRLRAIGVRIAIDDFGTGYSSLARLNRLPVDLIKLDRAFVTDIDRRPEARGMASAILQVSVAIGASIVAEGVETETEAATLVDLGYAVGQGYLFAKAMTIEEFSTRVSLEGRVTPILV